MGIINWLKKFFTFDPTVYKPPVDTSTNSGSEMTEGDFRSGPQGYSPNSSYPEALFNSGESSDREQDEGNQSR
jgi:hypothetical protein